MGLSSFAGKPLADVVAANDKTFFQIYWMGSREHVKQILEHAAAQGAKGVILTLDWTFAHRRDWGSPAIPEKLDLKALLKLAPEVVTKPRWLRDFALAGGPPGLSAPNMAPPGGAPPPFFGAYVEWMMTGTPSWEDIVWLREQWDGPLLFKGITHPEGAVNAADAGADAISVSNHGGVDPRSRARGPRRTGRVRAIAHGGERELDSTEMNLDRGAIGELLGSASDVTVAVYERLRPAILTLELAPGSRVDVDALAARMDTKVEILTEVIHALAQEGLVMPLAGDGVVVIAPLSLDDLIELYTLRVVGEADAIWNTVPVLDPAACDRLADELRDIDRYGASAAGHLAHRRFHQGLRVGVSERRQRELSRLFDHSQRYSLAAGRRKVVRGPAEHRAILRACFSGEQGLATKLLMRHCADTAYELIELDEPGRRTPSLDAAMKLLSERFDMLV